MLKCDLQVSCEYSFGCWHVSICILLLHSGTRFPLRECGHPSTPRIGDIVGTENQVGCSFTGTRWNFWMGLSTAIPLPNGENCFFVDVLNVTIEDREGRQDDSLFPQSKQPTLASTTICRYWGCIHWTRLHRFEGVPVAVHVEAMGRRDTDVTVRVTSILYDDLVTSGIQLPADFPGLPPSNPKSPNRANGLSIYLYNIIQATYVVSANSKYN